MMETPGRESWPREAQVGREPILNDPTERAQSLPARLNPNGDSALMLHTLPVGSMVPYNGVKQHLSPAWYAMIHMAAMQIGSVILALPSAFSSCTLYGTIAVLVIVCPIALLASHSLSCLWLHCKPQADALGRDRPLEYFDIAQIIGGDYFRKVAITLQLVVLCGNCTGAIIAFGQILFLVSGQAVDSIYLTLCAGCLCAFISLIPNFHDFIAFSVMGLLATIFTATVVCALSVDVGGIGMGTLDTEFKLVPFSQGLSTIVFTYSGFVVQPSIQSSLSRPEAMFRTYVGAWVYALFATVPVGVIGMYVYGSDVTGNVLYSLNHLSLLGSAHAFATAAGLSMTVHLIVGFGLSILPVVSVGEHMCLSARSPHFTLHCVLLRVGITACITLVAAAFPFFSDIIGLLGSFGASMLSFIFPFAMYLKAFWSTTHVSVRIVYLFIIAIMTVGAFGVGTYTSILGIADNAANYRIFPLCYACDRA